MYNLGIIDLVHYEERFSFLFGHDCRGALVAVAIMSYVGNFSNSGASIETPTVKRNQFPGVTLFEEPGEVMNLRSFKVKQVLSNGAVHMDGINKSKPGEFDFIAGTRVLFLPEDGVLYYDDQVITLPSTKCVRIIGTYRYETTGFLDSEKYVKTIPVLKVFDK